MRKFSIDDFFHHHLSAFLTCLLLTLLCSCNVPDPVPTATSTPVYTATPIPPTPTATRIPTATPTPLPDYLTIAPEELSGTTITLQFSPNENVQFVLEDLVRQFNDENPYGINVKAEAVFSKDELANQVKSAQTDLVIADSSWLRSINTEKDLYLELSPFLSDPSLGLSGENITPIMSVMMETENKSGKFFALPLWTEPAFLFYNKTWAIELGFPETPADLSALAEQACAAGRANYAEKDEGKHGTGGWIISSDPEDVMSWLLVFTQNDETPGDLIRKDSGDVFENSGAWLRNLYDNGCAWNSRIREPYDYFANRYALFYSGTYSDAKRQYNAFDQSQEHSQDNWDLIVYPTRTKGSASVPRIYADTVSVAVMSSKDDKTINAAWRFLRWLYQEDHAAKLSLAALGWPVQDSDEITKLYRNSGEDKLYQTLSYRQYLANSDTDENWLTDQRILSDGFAYIFNPSAKPEDIPDIWEQIGSLIAEINSVNNLSQSSNGEGLKETGENNETKH